VKYVPYFDTTLVPTTDARAVKPLVQLSYVLPGPSLGLLPVEVRERLLEKHKDWYNSDFEFGWAYCKYFWEAHAHMPRIDLGKLEQLIKI
jgi:5'-3' exonuclease